MEHGIVQHVVCFQSLSGDMVKEFLNENGLLYQSYEKKAQSYEKNCHISNSGFPSFFYQVYVHMLVSAGL